MQNASNVSSEFEFTATEAEIEIRKTEEYYIKENVNPPRVLCTSIFLEWSPAAQQLVAPRWNIVNVID